VWPLVNPSSEKLFLKVYSILVFSITFSEKIINYQTASTKARLLLLLSWVLFALAIITCGLALCYLALAGGQAVYGQGNYYPAFAYTSYQLIITAGFCFILGLITLIGTGALAIFSRRAS
jgi:hypothetical protein